MNANLNGYYDEIENAAEKKDDLLALLKDYKVTVHTCEEEDFDYLEKDDAALSVKNPNGEEDLLIELGSEFSFFFEKCHCRYDLYERDYEALKKDLTALLNGTAAALNFIVEDHWGGSAFCSQLPAPDADPADLVEHFCEKDELKQKLAQRGGRVELIFWSPEKNRDLVLSGNA